MNTSKTSKIPLDVGYIKNSVENSEIMDSNDLYRRAIGSVLFLSNNTRPDITVATSILSRKVSCPTKSDWNEVKRLLRYLTGSKNLKLCLNCSNFNLVGFADADFAGEISGRKSTSGYVFQLGGATISYSSRKQKIVTLSSTEAEFVSLADAAQELIWLRMLFQDIKIDVKDISIKEDNQCCLKLLDAEKINPRTKHIDVKYYFVRELKQTKEIQFEYCPTDEMLVDMLTKPLQRVKLNKFKTMIGLI
ncbi:uncharacterized protein LOC142235602 [Haematobia irritans]|uniref:uncharacterized protein LOC142235602 n=1 Tax=Haematobia irritans TaxID=7368 RepID=UPI003F5093B5